MKTFLWTLVLSLAALSFTACPPAENTENTNAENTNTTAEPAADLTKTLADRENEAYEAWKAKNGDFFDSFLADGFVGVGRFGRNGREDVVKAISANPCTVGSFSSSDQQSVELADGVALLTQKVTEDVECDGKKMPSPIWSASVFVEDGDTWKGVYHQTVTAPGAEGEYPAAPDGAGDTAPADADAELTKALSESIRAGWEAWSKNDAKWFEDNTSAKYFAITATDGRSDRAARIKYHGEHKCEIKSIAHDVQRTKKLGENVAILTYKSVVDGTCEGNSVAGTIWATSIYVKEGDAWKAAFYMGTPGT